MLIKDLCAVMSSFTDRQGNQKSKWVKLGELHENKDGSQYIALFPHINIAALPRKEGSDRVFVSLFTPKDGNDTAQTPKTKQDGLDEDVPF